ncbi:MAG TPA: GMP/IMP nucleotidase [Pseudomonadales bacterium]|nr:GMP/IMP nucleotidase [Pseudomonadales bacterium]
MKDLPARLNAPVFFDWNQIDTVLLDMDGTLLDLYFDNFFWRTHLPRRYAEARGLSEKAALDWLQTRFAEEQGKLNWYCLDFWQRELGLDIVALKREVSHLIAMRPHSASFLDALAAAGKSVWLVTNAHMDSIALKLEHTSLAYWLDRIISSHQLGAAKESQAFWHALQALHPFDAERTLFVDDTQAILNAAGVYGIQYLLCIAHPDSSESVRKISEFPAVADFDELLPI